MARGSGGDPLLALVVEAPNSALETGVGVTTARKPRAAWVDQIRGLAVLLMVADHVLSVAARLTGEGLFHVGRLGPTRLALPLFCLAAAWTPPRSRWSRVWLAIAAETVLNAIIGLGLPGPVALIVAGQWLLRHKWTWLAAVIAVIQPFTWPIPWSGYQPGTVLLLLGVGRFLADSTRGRLDRQLGARVEPVGRAPLVWYLGHLAVLAAVVVVW